MRRITLILAVLMLAALALPAAAANGKSDSSPAQTCAAVENTFPATDDRPFPFEFPSTGACVSSVAQGFPESHVLSRAAFTFQCKALESGLVESETQETFQLVYPYAFYGNPDYLAENRADCMYFLSSFHYGVLPPGPGGE